MAYHALKLAILLWRLIKIGDDAVIGMKDCYQLVETRYPGAKKDFFTIVGVVKDAPECKEPIFDAVRGVGITIAALGAIEQDQIFYLVAILMSIKFMGDNSVKFSSIPDVGTAICTAVSSFSFGRKRDVKGRYIK